MNTFDILGFLVAIVVAVFGSLYAFRKQKRKSLDGYLVKKLEDSGIDVSITQPIEFWFYSNNKDSIHQIESELNARGFEVVVNDTESDPGYVIHAYREMLPDIAKLQILRRDFNKLSRQHGCKYDGWGYSGHRS